MVNKLKLVSLAVSTLFAQNVQANSTDYFYLRDFTNQKLLGYYVSYDTDYFNQNILETSNNKTLVTKNIPNVYWDKYYLEKPSMSVDELGKFTISEPTNLLPSTFTSNYPKNVTSFGEYSYKFNVDDLDYSMVYSDNTFIDYDAWNTGGRLQGGFKFTGAFVYSHYLDSDYSTPFITYIPLDYQFRLNGVNILDTSYYVFALSQMNFIFRNYNPTIENASVERGLYIDYDYNFYPVQHRASSFNLSLPIRNIIPFACGVVYPETNFDVDTLEYKNLSSGNYLVSKKTTTKGDMIFASAPLDRLSYQGSTLGTIDNYNYVEDMTPITTQYRFSIKPSSVGVDFTPRYYFFAYPQLYRIAPAIPNTLLKDVFFYSKPIVTDSGADIKFMNFNYYHESVFGYPYTASKSFVSYGQKNNLDYKLGYDEGYNYAMSQIDSLDYQQSFGFLNNAMQGIKTLLDIEVFPNIKLSLFVFLPLMLGVLCLLMKFIS